MAENQHWVHHREWKQAKKLLAEHCERTGIADSILAPDELAAVFQIMLYAASAADDDGQTWWLVVSAETIYATPTPPIDPKDLDAVYVFELPSHGKRPDSLRDMLKTMRALKRVETKNA